MPTFDPSNTTQDALSILVQNFNESRALEKQINMVDFEYDNPAVDVFSGSNPRSTVLRVRPLLSSGQVGHIALRYERIDLNQLSDYQHVAGASSRVSDIIDSINARFGINLTSRDYVDVNLPLSGNTVIVPTKPISYLFYGSFSINVI